MPRLMIVDDNKDLLHLMAMRLKSAGHHVETAESGEQALARTATFKPHVVVTDLRMDGMDGMTLFGRLKDSQPTLPIIIITAHGSIPHAIEATRKGAFSYLQKPFDSSELLQEVDKALQLNGVDQHEEADSAPVFEEIITRNTAVLEILKQAKMVAQSDTSVLIQSESGTGKELLARAIHKASPRADKPFMALNCSSVPESLLESELFGHSKGAFTGAARDHKGLFQAAEGGTLFLDEVGDMPLHFQVKLLRVLQEKEVRPVGSTKAIPTNVRVVSATHRKLEDLIEKNGFREDLYYRLNVVQLDLPPLRERREDIPLLAQHFLKQLAQGDKKDRHFSAEAMELLVSAPWPGNIRQLCNVIEQTMVLSQTPVIPVDLVKRALKIDSGQIIPFVEAREHFERNYLIEILQITGGNVTQAAQLAQRNRTEFYRLLRKHHLDPYKFREH